MNDGRRGPWGQKLSLGIIYECQKNILEVLTSLLTQFCA